MLLASDISISKIATFLNSSSVISMIMLVTSIGVGIIFLSLIYHWGAYSPRKALKLGPDEHIVKVFRRHWFVFIFNIILIAFLIYAPRALSYIPRVYTDWALPFQPFLGALFSAWIAFLFITLLVLATNYFLDIWVLTNKRLVDVDQKGLFHRDISELRLEKIEDINVIVSGLLGTIIGIGNLKVQSAGATKEFKLINIASPEHARSMISSQASHKLDEVKKVEVVS